MEHGHRERNSIESPKNTHLGCEIAFSAKESHFQIVGPNQKSQIEPFSVEKWHFQPWRMTTESKIQLKPLKIHDLPLKSHFRPQSYISKWWGPTKIPNWIVFRWKIALLTRMHGHREPNSIETPKNAHFGHKMAFLATKSHCQIVGPNQKVKLSRFPLKNGIFNHGAWPQRAKFNWKH